MNSVSPPTILIQKREKRNKPYTRVWDPESRILFAAFNGKHDMTSDISFHLSGRPSSTGFVSSNHIGLHRSPGIIHLTNFRFTGYKLYCFMDGHMMLVRFRQQIAFVENIPYRANDARQVQGNAFSSQFILHFSKNPNSCAIDAVDVTGIQDQMFEFSCRMSFHDLTNRFFKESCIGKKYLIIKPNDHDIIPSQRFLISIQISIPCRTFYLTEFH